MLRITLEQWRMFKAVVEFGGFNQAAQGIHKSQSSIHHAVSKIESSLELKLFRIEGRKTVLTQAGQMMLRRANYLLDEAEKLEVIGQTLGEGVESKLTIAADDVFPARVLFEVIDKTAQQYPQLNIELIETVLTGAKEQVLMDNADIGISGFDLDHGVTEELCQIGFCAVASPEHPLHHLGRLVEIEDLKLHRQIVVRDSGEQSKADSGWLGANQRCTVSHIKTSVEMIANGFGYAWLPFSHTCPLLTAGVLKELPLKHKKYRTAVMKMIFKDKDCLGPAAQTFIEELRQASLSIPSLT